MTRRPHLTPDDLDMLQGLVRGALRRKHRGRATLRRKHGDRYNSDREDRQVRYLESLYRKLGGDPATITAGPVTAAAMAQVNESGEQLAALRAGAAAAGVDLAAKRQR